MEDIIFRKNNFEQSYNVVITKLSFFFTGTGFPYSDKN